MPRWEYLEVYVDGSTWNDSMGRQGRLGGTLSANSHVGTLGPLLNELGEQGWEIAGIGPRDGYNYWSVFLKRGRD